eukprot:2296355-Pleurochrysis_carterae.AAC.1
MLLYAPTGSAARRCRRPRQPPASARCLPLPSPPLLRVAPSCGVHARASPRATGAHPQECARAHARLSLIHI